MYQKIKHAIGSNLINLQGWRTKRKLLVLESDDWGTIRMPGLQEREFLCSRYPQNFNVSTYDRYDNLANTEDLSALFDVLVRFKDFKGNHPVITANTIVANPDFDKIRASNFQSYFYEPFTETLERYPSHQGTFALWQQGMRSGVFHPQLHGREHLNVALWMKLLQMREPSSIAAFERRTWVMKSDQGNRLDIAFDYESEKQLKGIDNYLKESAILFRNLFGYDSMSYIAPSYTWNDDIERILQNINIRILQGGLFQILPTYTMSTKNARRVRHYVGQRNMYGQVYLMRNSYFEPSLIRQVDLVGKCLGDIERAFRWGKPAIISIHRLNFIGNLEKNNRTETLKLLASLLQRVLVKFPDVEFLTSDALGKEMLKMNV